MRSRRYRLCRRETVAAFRRNARRSSALERRHDRRHATCSRSRISTVICGMPYAVSAPLVILHRRNRIELLSALPSGAWIEIDIDLVDGEPVLTHDPVTPNATAPSQLADFLPQALRRGVSGFVFDCKREDAEYAVEPFLAANIDRQLFLYQRDGNSGRYVSGADSGAQNRDAHLAISRRARCDPLCRRYEKSQTKRPRLGLGRLLAARSAGRYRTRRCAVTQTDARNLQKLGVKLCLCSPELYVHDYRKKYKASELEDIYRGVVHYRKNLMQVGIQVDAACTKFPWLWTMEIDLLLKAKTLSGV